MSLRHALRLPRSFRAQLACCFALLGALLAVSLSAALGSMLAQKSRRDAGSNLHSVAHNAAQLLGDGLNLRLREVQALASSATMWSEGLAAARVDDNLQRSQAVHPYSAWIGVADAQGIVRTATGQLLVGVDVRQRPWFKAGLQAPFVGDVHPAKLLAGLLPPASDGGPQRFVDFAAPIWRQGQLLGVIGIHGSWEWTRATIESLLPAAADRMGVEVLVFDRSGQPIYAPGATLARHVAAGQRLPLLLASAAGASAAAGAGSARVLAWGDGEDCLSAAAVLPVHGAASDLGWTVVARQPVAVAYAAGRHGAWLALALGLAAAALAAVSGAWLAGELTRPLRRMARDAEALGTAATLQALPQRGGSLEVEQLSGALGAMTARLLQANTELEQRVQARTAELERANAELARLAQHDPLTGLLNRRGLDERLVALAAGARRRQAPLSLLVLDVDHFKQVNDRHGHDVGDQVLRAIAQVLRQRLREVDIVARFGGEEFVVVLADTAAAGAGEVSAALVAAVRQAAMPVVGTVTISCGAAELRTGRENPEAALRRADEALYEAKQGGRNRHCLAPLPVTEAAPLQPA